MFKTITADLTDKQDLTRVEQVLVDGLPFK